jgi:hypothetical protein
VTLTATDNTGGSGVANTKYTTDGTDPASSVTALTYSGPFTVSQTTTVKFRSVDVAGNAEATKSQAVTFTVAAPVTTIACNGAACSSGWYNAAVSVTLSATDTGGPGIASTHYTTDGTTPSLSSPTYTGAFTVSTTKTVKFRSWDTAGNIEATKSQKIQIDTTKPTTTITCNGGVCTGTFSGSVTVALSATDAGSGVASTKYTTDGTDPATSPTALTYSGPFTVSQATTVKFRSVDVAGNAETTKTQSIGWVTPVTTIACNGAPCITWYKAAVSVTLSATDAGGPGVSSTHYTLNGTTPTLSSTTYTGAFSVSTTKTVEFRSWDTAGTAEATKTQVIQIDTAKPTTTISCNGATCSTSWYTAAPVAVTLTAADTGGSGVDKTYYTTDGTTPTTSSTVYTGGFNVPQTTTIKYMTTDKAGNTSTVGSTTIKIDATPPTVAITKPTNGSTLKAGTITVTASASDAGTGTGAASAMAQVEFFVDGASIGVDTTASPWSASWTAAVGTHSLYAIATDKAGNTTKSATITVTVN